MVLLLATMDWIFILFHLTMFIWACILYFRFENTCSNQWDFWVLIYIIFGFIACSAIVCVLFMGFFRSMNKKKYIDQHPEHQKIHHPEDYVVEADYDDKNVLTY